MLPKRLSWLVRCWFVFALAVPGLASFDFDTLAGVVGVQGGTDGTVGTARFFRPKGVAADGVGNVYVADSFNHVVRKISAAGVVTTLAGSAGLPGNTNNSGALARFNTPMGVAVDSAGNVYVADRNNHLIRKVTAAGVVTTLAGTAGVAGSLDGTGVAARFNCPEGVAVDAAGNVYVADTCNSTIRKISAAGVVTTLAGSAAAGAGSTDATGSAARFSFPRGVTVNSAGTLLSVADTSNYTIRQITGAGVVTTLAGMAGSSGAYDGDGAYAAFGYPESVAVDATGTLWVVDSKYHTLRKITAGGTVTTIAGTAGLSGSVDTNYGPDVRFNQPGGVAVDPNGRVYIADTGNHTIRSNNGIEGGNGWTFTLAGRAGRSGSADGTTAAVFGGTGSVALDTAGNVYVADGSLVRKISSAGIVTTLAGSPGVYGTADGTGGAAAFRLASGIAVDAAGYVYVTDEYAYTVRKISPTGVVTTLAGLAGASGSANGTGSAARFYFPKGIAVDSSGNLYVADNSNYTIRKITPAGVVTTLAGSPGSSGSTDATGSSARFYYPEGIAVDGSGNVYVADTYNKTIRKITAAGAVTTLAGSAVAAAGSLDGTGAGARFSYPRGVAVNSAGTMIYVSDTSNYTIRQVTSAGVVTTLAGLAGNYGYADGTGSSAQFKYPKGLVVSAGGNIFVGDYGRIRKIAPGAVVSTFAGSTTAWGSNNGLASGLFGSIRRVAVDAAGNIYVADSANHTIRKITPLGIMTTLAGSPGEYGFVNGTGSAARFYSPSGVTVDGSGNVYVADTWNHAIRKITAAGVVTTLAGSGFSGSANGTGAAASFYWPENLVVDTSGNVYVVDTYNSAIRKITSGGVVTTLAGVAGSPGSSNGNGAAARFSYPQGIAMDSNGNLFVADTQNSIIRKVTAAGDVTTLAGTAGVFGGDNGTGPAASFNSPGGLAVDSSGNVFVADTWNHLLRKITTAGVVTTVAGSLYLTGSTDGLDTDARFNGPAGIAVDSSGNLIVADTENNLLRKGALVAAQPPTVVEQPQALASVVNASVTFRVVVRGTAPFTYQWKKNGAVIVGATSSSLQLDYLQTTDAGNYLVTVTGAAGSVDSQPVALTVNVPPPVVDGQPSDIGVTAGLTAPFSASAVGSSLTIQWQESRDDKSTWQNLLNNSTYQGVDTFNLSVKTVSSMNGYWYRCRFSNGAGTVYSSPARLTVNDRRPVITTQPENQSVGTGGAVSFTAQFNADPIPTYQWLRKPNGSGTFSALVESGTYAGTQSETLTVSNAALVMSGDQFFCTATNQGGDASSNAATLTVVAPTATTFSLNQTSLTYTGLALGPTILANPSVATYVAGGTLSATNVGNYTATATATGSYSGTNNALNWSITKTNQNAPVISSAGTATVGTGYTATANTGYGAVVWALGLGSTAPGAGINPTTGVVAFTGAGLVRIKAQFGGDANHNASLFSADFTITVISIATPVFATQPLSQTVQSGSPFSFSVLASGTPAPTYQWQRYNADIPSATGTSYGQANAIAADAGTYRAIATNSAGSAISNSALLTVITPQNNFKGNGRSAPLWHNTTTGATWTWFTDGGSLGFGNEGGGWSVISSGDFNGDGFAEPLWRNANTGEIRAWFLTGGSIGFGNEGGGWTVIPTGTGDFDGDGRAEPLWRNTNTGVVYSWLSAGGSVGFGSEGGGWTVISSGDFDGDTFSEPLWRNTNTGVIRTWYLAGGSLTLGIEGGGWAVIPTATGDYAGDGRSAPLWHNTNTGEIRVWFSGGGSVGFGNEGGGWTVFSTGDFDGDGRAEPLWRNSNTGVMYSWFSAGGGIGLGVEGGGWEVIY